MSAARIIRDRLAATSALRDRAADSGPDCGSTLVVQTTMVTTYPTVANVYYAVNPCDVNGTETEGQTASLVADTTTTLYALNLGTGIPPRGTQVVATSVGGRLTFRYDG